MGAFEEKVYIDTYNATLNRLYQQKVSKLIGLVRKESKGGTLTYHDQIAGTSGRRRTTYNAPTPSIPIDFARRVISNETWDTADFVDPTQVVQVLQDPTSAKAEAMAMAAARKTDQILYDAIRGAALTETGGVTSVPLPSTQKIAVGGTPSGLTLDKLSEAKFIMDDADVPMENRVLMCGAEQIADLNTDTTITSADYNTDKTISEGDGNVRRLMGFQIITVNGVRDGDSLLSGARAGNRILYDTGVIAFCVAFDASNIILNRQMGLSTSVDARADLSNVKQILSTMMLGATRMQEKGVVEIACKTAAL